MARSMFVIGKSLRAFYLGGIMQKQQRLAHYLPGLVAQEDDEEFDCKFESYFNRADIDGWEVSYEVLLLFLRKRVKHFLLLKCVFSRSFFFFTLKLF